MPYRRPPSRSRTNGEPYAGARTVAAPPMCTMLAGFRATWSNPRGAVACTSWRASPRGNRTRSPSTAHPAPFSNSSASGASRNSIPTCSRIVSALCSIVARPSSLTISTGVSSRVMNGTRSATAARRGRACLLSAGATPARRRLDVAPVSSLTCCSSRVGWRVRGGGAVARRDDAPAGRSTTAPKPRERIGGVRDAHRPDEVLLEPWFHAVSSSPRAAPRPRSPRGRPGSAARCGRRCRRRSRRS